MKRKSIIVICAVLVISGVATVLVLTGNRGNVSNVKRVVGYSALYGENSIKEFESSNLSNLSYHNAKVFATGTANRKFCVFARK